MSAPQGNADAAEWRTPPLWGIGLVEANAGARYLDDGRAASLRDAVLWHAGEASSSRHAYAALGPSDEQALLAFIRSL